MDKTEEFAKHIFREHNKVTETWADREEDVHLGGDILGTVMHSSTTSTAARGVKGLELKSIVRFVFFFCTQVLLCVEEAEIWQRAAAWIEKSLDTVRRQ